MPPPRPGTAQRKATVPVAQWSASRGLTAWTPRISFCSAVPVVQRARSTGQPAMVRGTNGIIQRMNADLLAELDAGPAVVDPAAAERQRRSNDIEATATLTDIASDAIQVLDRGLPSPDSITGAAEAKITPPVTVPGFEASTMHLRAAGSGGDADRGAGPGPCTPRPHPGTPCQTSADPPDPVRWRAGQPPVSWELLAVGRATPRPTRRPGRGCLPLLDAVADFPYADLAVSARDAVLSPAVKSASGHER